MMVFDDTCIKLIQIVRASLIGGVHAATKGLCIHNLVM